MRLQRILLILIILIQAVSLSALSPGLRVHTGLSGGIGKGWNEVLDDAGDRDFSDPRICFGVSAFADLPLEEEFFFVPELGAAFMRGTRLSNKDGDAVEMVTPVTLELLLPLARDISFSDGDKALRLMGGLQLLYGWGFELRTDVDGDDQRKDTKNLNALSAGLVLGAGLEFQRLSERSWFVDLRLRLPVTDDISYDKEGGGRYHLSTVQLMLGGGVKHH